MQKHTLEVVATEPGRDLLRRPVGHDATAGDEDDALTQPLDLHHVVTGDEERGLLFSAQPFKSGTHPEGNVWIK